MDQIEKSSGWPSGNPSYLFVLWACLNLGGGLLEILVQQLDQLLWWLLPSGCQSNEGDGKAGDGKAIAGCRQERNKARPATTFSILHPRVAFFIAPPNLPP